MLDFRLIESESPNSFQPGTGSGQQPRVATSRAHRPNRILGGDDMALPKKEDAETVNICGCQYVLRSEIARFNTRAAAGEFAKPPNQPKNQIHLLIGSAFGSVDHV